MGQGFRLTAFAVPTGQAARWATRDEVRRAREAGAADIVVDRIARPTPTASIYNLSIGLASPPLRASIAHFLGDPSHYKSVARRVMEEDRRYTNHRKPSRVPPVSRASESPPSMVTMMTSSCAARVFSRRRPEGRAPAINVAVISAGSRPTGVTALPFRRRLIALPRATGSNSSSATSQAGRCDAD